MLFMMGSSLLLSLSLLLGEKAWKWVRGSCISSTVGSNTFGFECQ